MFPVVIIYIKAVNNALGAVKEKFPANFEKKSVEKKNDVLDRMFESINNSIRELA